MACCKDKGHTYYNPLVERGRLPLSSVGQDMANLLTDPESGRGRSWGGLHQPLVTPQRLHLLQGLAGVDSLGGAGGQGRSLLPCKEGMRPFFDVIMIWNMTILRNE